MIRIDNDPWSTLAPAITIDHIGKTSHGHLIGASSSGHGPKFGHEVLRRMFEFVFRLAVWIGDRDDFIANTMHSMHCAHQTHLAGNQFFLHANDGDDDDRDRTRRPTDILNVRNNDVESKFTKRSQHHDHASAATPLGVKRKRESKRWVERVRVYLGRLEW